MRRAVLAVLVWILLGPAARAEVIKVALLMGNNRGEPGEVELLYAHEDARKVAGVLQKHGGFAAEDVTLLIEGDARQARQALLTLNERIRARIQDGEPQVLLFVYYSGHADAQSLHLGESLLPLSELRKMVRGSAARFRVLILDSCKSGGLTRVKGGRPVAPFELSISDELSGEGTVLITSSAFDEDAQESDRVRGSLFTHHFVSGLLGAADVSADAKVSLSEAYRYAYEQTLKSTSRTWAGTQHPTYQYDIKGKGDVILTELSIDGVDKTSLVFPRPGKFLVMKGDQDGPVVAEVESARPGRRLVLEPGRYYVRERAPDELREGEIVLGPGREHTLTDWHYTRIAYARLVRKGEGIREVTHGPALHYRHRGEILSGLGPMHLFGIGYPVTLRWLTLTPRISLGQASAENDILRSRTDEVDFMLEATYALDVSIVTFAAGLEVGGAWFRQHFETPGQAPTREYFGFAFGAIATVSVDLAWGCYTAVGAEALTYVLSLRDDEGGSETVTPLTYVFSTTVGVNF